MSPIGMCACQQPGCKYCDPNVWQPKYGRETKDDGIARLTAELQEVKAERDLLIKQHLDCERLLSDVEHERDALKLENKRLTGLLEGRSYLDGRLADRKFMETFIEQAILVENDELKSRIAELDGELNSEADDIIREIRAVNQRDRCLKALEEIKLIAGKAKAYCMTDDDTMEMAGEFEQVEGIATEALKGGKNEKR